MCRADPIVQSLGEAFAEARRKLLACAAAAAVFAAACHDRQPRATTPSGATTGAIAGMISAAGAGTPLANACVTVRRAGLLVGGVVTGPDGRFAMSAVPSGIYVVAAARSGFGSTQREVPVAVGEEAMANFALAEDPSASGANDGRWSSGVVEDGLPVEFTVRCNMVTAFTVTLHVSSRPGCTDALTVRPFASAAGGAFSFDVNDASAQGGTLTTHVDAQLGDEDGTVTFGAYNLRIQCNGSYSFGFRSAAHTASVARIDS